MKRFVVYGEGPHAPVRPHAPVPQGWNGKGDPGLYGVVADKYERDFFGRCFYGPAQDGERQLIAEWPPNCARFCRELSKDEEWPLGIRDIYGHGEDEEGQDE